MYSGQSSPTVAADDRFHRRVGFESRGINARSFAADGKMFLSHQQNKGENLIVNIERESLFDFRQRTVIGRFFGRFQPEKTPQRKAVRTPPGDAPLRADIFEVPNEQHSKVDAGSNPRASLIRIIRFAKIFEELIEPGTPQATDSTVHKKT